MSIVVSMSLDFPECDRARLARDPSYDGRFYTGVHTTGIYCRPVCPVHPARSANVSFFASAAAAEAAGFRPCLRCRPETAPFCSAWIGSRATVERALRLIVEDGALDGEGATVERLAVRLGVGARQLTRLFVRHLQASPAKVARTARVQRANGSSTRRVCRWPRSRYRRALAVYAGSTPSLPKSTADRRLKFGAHGNRPLRR